MSNLSEKWENAVKEIEPWVFNTLIDWFTPFEQFVQSLYLVMTTYKMSGKS